MIVNYSRDASLEKTTTAISGQWGSPMQNETLDLQLDYWPAGSSFQPNKKDDKKEQNKVSLYSFLCFSFVPFFISQCFYVSLAMDSHPLFYI